MLKIRLMRIGARKKPFYRVVAVDERSKRTGAYIELLGTYNPLTEPKDIKLKQDRIDYWIKQGAQMSTGFLRIIGKAPQKPPRKPKKARVPKEEKVSEAKEKPAEGKPAQEELKVEEQPAEETVQSEETKPEEASKEDSKNNEKEEVVDDSAEKPESIEPDTSESVQNKKDEGSA